MTNDQKIEFLKSKGVDVETGISNMMDIDTYDEILNDFYEGLNEQKQNIDTFKVALDMPNYAILVHALKSNARSFGFNKLGDLAYEHEMASKRNDINYVNEHYSELTNEIDEVYNIIAEYKSL